MSKIYISNPTEIYLEMNTDYSLKIANISMTGQDGVSVKQDNIINLELVQVQDIEMEFKKEIEIHEEPLQNPVIDFTVCKTG